MTLEYMQLSHLFLQQFCEMDTITTPMLQMSELKLNEVK